MLTGFNHLTLAVCSLPRSIAFHEETLGFKLSARWKAEAYLSLGDLWLCLSTDSLRAEDMQRNYTHYAFSIDQKNSPSPGECLASETCLGSTGEQPAKCQNRHAPELSSE